MLATTIRPWGSLPLDRALAGAAAAGFTAVALPVHGIAAPVTGNTSRAQVERIGATVTANELTLIALAHEAEFHDGEAEALAVLRRQIDHCAALKVDLLVDVGCTVATDFDAYLRLMRAGARYAADHEVTIAVKPHGGLTRTVVDTLDTVTRVDSEAFRVCLDTGMLVHHAGDDALSDLADLAALVVALGARDHPGRGRHRPDPARDAAGQPPALTPGDGIVDFHALYTELTRHGFTGPTILESTTPASDSAGVDVQARRARVHLEGVLCGGPRHVEPPRAPAPRPDCSTLATLRDEPLIGTARHFDGYLLVEVDLPWPRAMGLPLFRYPRIPDNLYAPLQQVRAHVRRAGRTVKELALAPDARYSRPGLRRVMRYDLVPAPTSGYRGREYVVPDAVTPQLITALYDPDETALNPFQQWLHRGESYRDLLVCTHGSVDSCCGTYGYPLYEQLRERLGSDPATRAWRVSSFGGHRFAPTLIDLPDGRYWGNLGSADLDGLIIRRGNLTGLLARYRGCGAWSHPIAQVAESALFARYGWSWSGIPHEFTSLDTGVDARHARLLARVGHLTHQGEPAAAFSIDIDLIGDAEVMIGCSGLLGSVPRYTARSVTPVDPTRMRDRPINLGASAHAERGNDDSH